MSIIHIHDGRENATVSGSLKWTTEAGVQITLEDGTTDLEFDGVSSWSVVIEHIPSLPRLYHITKEDRFSRGIPLNYILLNSAGEEILNSAGENILTETNDTQVTPLYHM